jgi:hypothetical protein
MPGTAADTGLNSPQTSAGVSGFRSSVSSGDGHPHVKRKMQALAGLTPAVPTGCCIRADYAGQAGQSRDTRLENSSTMNAPIGNNGVEVARAWRRCLSVFTGVGRRLRDCISKMRKPSMLRNVFRIPS